MALIVFACGRGRQSTSSGSQILEIGLEALPGPIIHLNHELQGPIHGRFSLASLIDACGRTCSHMPLSASPWHWCEHHTPSVLCRFRSLEHALSLEPATA